MASRSRPRPPEAACPEQNTVSRSSDPGRDHGASSLLQNLIAAASDLPEDTVQRIVKHADSIKAGKAEEILKRLEGTQLETK